MDRVPMTKQGHADLQKELRRLKREERPTIVRQIEEARAHGDLSENAEYHAAKERQAILEARSRQIEDRLARAQIIDPRDHSTDSVRFGMTVVLSDIETAEEVTYTLVGEDEVDVAQRRISINSPVARALLGKSVDDCVTVRVPKGTREFQILAIRAE
ncbi:MAG: transcription elongation factor GreA [Deltaproteobacteria bacterium]|nr:MAG: transcription elongation factor GreA [Deltaproteobacteria bacterium]